MEMDRRKPGKQGLAKGTEDRKEEERKMQESLQHMLSWGAALGISDSSSSLMATLTGKLHNLCIGCTLSVSCFPKAGGWVITSFFLTS